MMLRWLMYIALSLLIAAAAMVNSACYFEQDLDSSTVMANKAYVRWQVRPTTPRRPCTATNPHIRQGVLKISTPSNAKKVIIELHQKGDTCFASWHLAMDWADGYGGRNAEIHTKGDELLWYGRYPGAGPDDRPPGQSVTNFISEFRPSKVNVTIYDVRRSSWTDRYNIVDKFYPECETHRMTSANGDMFRIADMRTRPVYLGLNRVVNGRSGREGAGLYYVCVNFEY